MGCSKSTSKEMFISIQAYLKNKKISDKQSNITLKKTLKRRMIEVTNLEERK